LDFLITVTNNEIESRQEMNNPTSSSDIFNIQKRICLRVLLSIVLGVAVLTTGYSTGDNFGNEIIWKEIGAIPSYKEDGAQLGLASPFAGYHNGNVIIAGGCNFPGKPVYDGGIKKYYDHIYILDENGTISVNETRFPFPIAYGASVSTDYGLVCVGGNNLAKSSDKVNLLSWHPEEEEIKIEEWPSLPYRMTNSAAAIVENIIYVAGGMADDQLANKFVSLDLSTWGTDEFLWKELEEFPGPARIQPVAISQNAAEEAHFYLFSGSSFPEDAEHPYVTTDGLEYNPKTGSWAKLSDIKPKGKNSYSLHGGSGIAVGTHHIIFLGGVNKDIFTDAWKRERAYSSALGSEDTLVSGRLANEIHNYFTQIPEWYQFNKEVLAYHTITGTWAIIDDYPFPAPAGAPIVKANKGWYVISGEIKPGVRSPKVYFGKAITDAWFGSLNWILLVIYLFGMLYMGYYFMRRENTTNDFFKGGQRIPWWAAGMSIFATMLSAITFMAIPAKTYATDWRYFMMAVTIFVVAIPVVKYYLPFFRRLKVTTAYEYLEKRFNSATRMMASGIFIIFMVARTALVLFLPSLALTTVTGIDIHICIILMGLITIIYCTMGGVEAVIWGDVIQGFVLMAGAILAVIFLIHGTEGGMNKVIDITVDHNKMRTFNMAISFTSATFWVVLLGGLANNLISYSSDQTVIQRYLTTRDERSAGRSIIMNGILSILVSMVFYFIGTALFAFYKTNPEQLNMSMNNPDSIFPHFIMTKMPQGIAGIMIAAIFAATMSTISSSINSLSTAFTTDFYQRWFSNKTDKHLLKIARLTGIILGSVGVGLAIMMATWNILSLFDYFNYILGLLASGLGGLFFMGIFIPRIKGKAAIAGFLGGFLTVLIVKSQTDIHLMLYGFVGMVSAVCIGFIFSFILPEKDKLLDGLTVKALKSNR
jgi:cyclically-permuted mutarotase family protein